MVGGDPAAAGSGPKGGALGEGAGVELLTGLEPVTSSLPRKCSTTELQQHLASTRGGSPTTRWRRRRRMERVGGIEPPCAAWKAAVLPLNYTRKVGRAGRRRRAERGEIRGIWGGLPPTATESSAVDRAAAREDLPSGVEPWRVRRGRLVGEAGFEPAKAEPSDLQSDPFGRSGIPPPGIPEPGGAAPTCGPHRRLRVRERPTGRSVRSRAQSPGARGPMGRSVAGNGTLPCHPRVGLRFE